MPNSYSYYCSNNQLGNNHLHNISIYYPRVFNTVDDENLSDEVTQAASLLLRGIQEGRFAPGQRLSENEMMERLSIKRGKVRQVFKYLEKRGVIKMEKNRGASVRRVTRREISDHFELLEILSLLAIKKIANRLDEEEVVKRLKALLRDAKKFRRQSVNTTRIHDFTHENEHFWGELADLSGNSLLSDIRLQVESPLHRLSLEGLTITESKDRNRWINNHESLLTALLEGDAKRASKLTEESIHAVHKAINSLSDTAFI